MLPARWFLTKGREGRRSERKYRDLYIKKNPTSEQEDKLREVTRRNMKKKKEIRNTEEKKKIKKWGVTGKGSFL